MNNIRNRLIVLHEAPFLTRYKLRKYMIWDRSLTKLFTFNPTEISEVLHVSMKKALQIYKHIQQKNAILSRRQDCDILTIYDKDYPPQLKAIPDPPLVLYLKGDRKLLTTYPSLSVIGTRKPSQQAFPKLNQMITPLIKGNWVIVSGFAYGIDSMAHELTLRHHGKTIAVLGGGFEHVYPRTNVGLYYEIVKYGLVISEYPPNIRPQRYHFPERNRIISGLSNATLVIEALERSGTLITVDQALEQGREVYVMPGSPLIPETKGCHKLIQEGAKLVIQQNDILEDWL